MPFASTSTRRLKKTQRRYRAPALGRSLARASRPPQVHDDTSAGSQRDAPKFHDRPLEWFGYEVDAGRNPCVDVGGFIVPGNAPVNHPFPGNGARDYGGIQEEGQSQENQCAQSRTGAQARTTRCPETHPVLPVTFANVSHMLEELRHFYPGTRVVSRSSSFAGVIVPIGLFLTLSYRARIAPVQAWEGVRAWALREYPSGRRTLIASHHRGPDGTMCTHSGFEWIYGVHSILDYMSYCVFWVAKALYDQKFKCYPGPQHCPVIMRMERDRPDEYCGCGSDKRYRECHRPSDLAMYPEQRREIGEQEAARRQQYRDDLWFTNRSPKVPDWVRR